MERIERTLHVKILIDRLALIEMLEEGFFGYVVVRVVGTLEHVLAFDCLFESLHRCQRIINYGMLRSREAFE
jgi:hypothetical protein